MKKWLKRIPLILLLAALMLIIGALLNERVFDLLGGRDVVAAVVGAVAVFLLLVTVWLYGEQR